MRRALSLLDQRDWDAREFAAADNEWRQTRKQHLVCLACGGRAAFKMGQKRAPFFSASHKSRCVLLTTSWSAFSYLQH